LLPAHRGEGFVLFNSQSNNFSVYDYTAGKRHTLVSESMVGEKILDSHCRNSNYPHVVD